MLCHRAKTLGSLLAAVLLAALPGEPAWAGAKKRKAPAPAQWFDPVKGAGWSDPHLAAVKGRVRARIDGNSLELDILRVPRRKAKANNGRLDIKLKDLLAVIEDHFDAKAQIFSGCRTPEHNRAVGGAPHSYHLTCDAADIVIAGVSKEAIRAYVASLPQRGGIGTYCYLSIVHVDVGPVRSWHRPCVAPPAPGTLDRDEDAPIPVAGR